MKNLCKTQTPSIVASVRQIWYFDEDERYGRFLEFQKRRIICQEVTKMDKKMKYLESKTLNRTHLLILALIAGTGAIFILVCTKKYGTGFSADSVEYMAAAHNLLAGRGFLMSDGEISASWPPLYPMLLALLKFCGLNYIVSTRCICAVTFGLTSFLAGLWVLKYSQRLFLAALCSLAILCSKPLTWVFCYAWSEPIFLVLLMLYFLILPSVIKKPSIKCVVALGVVTAAACLTRYIGGVLFVIVVVLLMINREHSFRKRLTSASVFGIVSVLPLGLWLLRNWVLTDTLTGPRFPSERTLLTNIDLAGKLIASWYLPSQIVNAAPGFVFFCLFSALITMIVAYNIRRCRKNNQYWLHSPEVILASFLVVYTGAILAMLSRIYLLELNDRYLTPLYLAAVLLFLVNFKNIFSLDIKLIQAKKEFFGKLIRTGILGGICIGIWFGTGANYVLTRAERMVKYGAGGRNSVRWQQSETVGWLKSHQLSGDVFSNKIFTVFFFTRHTCKKIPTHPTGKWASHPEFRRWSRHRLAEFKKAVKSKEPAYLVWFAAKPRPYTYSLEQLQDLCRMTVVKKLEDGAIIALNPK